MADQSEWYDYRKLNSYNALWSFVSGPRSIGKTWGAKRDIVKAGLDDEYQAAWVRRTKTEMDPAKVEFFGAAAPIYPGYEFRTDGPAGQIREFYGDENEPGPWRTIVRFIPLSTSSQVKGTEFPKVRKIVYDECFTELGASYLTEEVERLRGLWQTIGRSRLNEKSGKVDVKALLLGNARTLDNPWFLEYDFDGEREWQKGRETDGDVVLHLVDASKYVRRVGESTYGKVLGTQSLDYNEGRYFMPDGGLVVSERDPQSRPFGTLVSERGTFGLWDLPRARGMYVTVGPLNDKHAPVFTFEPMMVRPGVPLVDHSHYIRQEVRRQYRRGSIFLVTNAAMAARYALAK